MVVGSPKGLPKYILFLKLGAKCLRVEGTLSSRKFRVELDTWNFYSSTYDRLCSTSKEYFGHIVVTKYL